MQPLNPQALRTKARLTAWRVQTHQLAQGPGLILDRDGWQIQVLFHGITAVRATILKTGATEHEVLDLNLIYRWVRASSTQMRKFRIGDRVLVGDDPGRPGTVTNIYPDADDRPNRLGNIKLTVGYDDGGHGHPYVSHAHRLEPAA
jgi:hypothetical protein